MVLIVRCTSAWEMHLRGQGWGGLQRLWPPAGGAVVLPEIGAVWRDLGGDTGSSGSGAKHPTPQSASPPQKSPQAHLSEPCFHFARVRNAFGFVFLSQTVVPKIVNLKNHGEAHTEANTRGFIYKLELVSKYTDNAEQGLRSRGEFLLRFKGLSRGPPEGL